MIPAVGQKSTKKGYIVPRAGPQQSLRATARNKLIATGYPLQHGDAEKERRAPGYELTRHWPGRYGPFAVARADFAAA